MTIAPTSHAERVFLYTAELFDRFSYVYDRPISLVNGQEFYGVHRSYHNDKYFKGCLYDANMRIVKSTLRFNENDIIPQDPEFLSDQLSFKEVNTFCLYGGILFPIFGHFLVETLSRFWPLMQYKDIKHVYFHHWPGLDVNEFKNNQTYRLIFETFGLSIDKVLLVNEELKFSNMILPKPMSIYHSYIHPGMNIIYDRIVDACGRSARSSKRKIFLSRSMWAANRRISNEAVLDDVFSSLGYEIVFPEAINPRELICQIAEAETIAATDGSHAHLIAFASPKTKFVSLDTRVIPTQVALAALRDVQSLHVPLHEGVFFDTVSRNVIDLSELSALLVSIEDKPLIGSLVDGRRRFNSKSEAWSLYRLL